MQKGYCIGVFSFVLGAALADSPSLIPTASLIIFGMATMIGSKLWAELDF